MQNVICNVYLLVWCHESRVRCVCLLVWLLRRTVLSLGQSVGQLLFLFFWNTSKLKQTNKFEIVGWMKNVPRLYFFFRFWTFIFVQISKNQIFVEQIPSKSRSFPFCSGMLKIVDLVCYHSFFLVRRGWAGRWKWRKWKNRKKSQAMHRHVLYKRWMPQIF